MYGRCVGNAKIGVRRTALGSRPALFRVRRRLIDDVTQYRRKTTQLACLSGSEKLRVASRRASQLLKSVGSLLFLIFL